MSKTPQNTVDTPICKADVYARITQRIVKDLEQGLRPWMKPWRTTGSIGQGLRPLRFNGLPYRGINVLLLWSEAIDKGFESAQWMTYRQAQALSGQVRKGESGSLVVFADQYTRCETGEDGQQDERSIAFMKGYTVFNVDQIDGLPSQYRKVPDVVSGAVNVNRVTEEFFARTGARFQHGGNAAFYMPSGDYIQLPPVDAFDDPESYGSTKAHELVHWTGHSDRMAREFGARFGDEAYAFEELVAELGAAFLCADLGITPEVRDDHAAYLGQWLKVLKGNSRAVFSAAAHAQQAVDYLHELQTVVDEKSAA